MMGQLYVMLGSMAAGAGVALVPRFSRSGFWREVCESGATVICGMASVMRLLWTLEDDEYSRANQVRLALVSGAFGDIHRAFEERYKLSIVDCFGMTEAEPATLPVLGRADPGSHGLASPDFEVRIFDEADSELEAGAIGEIVLRPRRASVMFQGYEGDGEATVRVWRNLWFHTGDLGFIDPAGVLHFLDRRIYGIRRLGENISVWEVEELLHTMPGIAAAVAVGIDAAPGEQDVKAILVRAPGAQITEPEVHRWCASEMAKFMVPRYVEFLDELPRLALGKVDRSQLGHAGPGVWDAQAAILDG
jgi:crotonobetaine/carnitine-CoA ligase